MCTIKTRLQKVVESQQDSNEKTQVGVAIEDVVDTVSSKKGKSKVRISEVRKLVHMSDHTHHPIQLFGFFYLDGDPNGALRFIFLPRAISGKDRMHGVPSLS